MRQCQPLGEQECRFIGRLAVKRHHRRRHPWKPPELRAPAVAYRRHLDVVRTTADGLFVAMNDHSILSGVGNVRGTIERRRFYARVTFDQAKAATKIGSTSPIRR